MSEVKVSIIVPIYNVEQYLRRCIDSLINQTLREIEIILIDDASPDNCGMICDEYAKKDNRIKVVHKKNEGLGISRNVGVSIAKGEYCAFIDSDDYIDENAYEKMYMEAKKNNADVCFCGVKFLDANGKEKSRNNNEFDKKLFKDEEIVNDVLFNMLQARNKDKKVYNMQLGGVWKAIYSKKIFEENNIQFCSEREIISEDYVFHIDYISKCKTIVFISDIFYYHCTNNSSLTTSYKKDRLEKNKILYNVMNEKVKQLGIYEETNTGITSIFMGSIRHCILQEVFNKNKKDAISKIREISNDEIVKETVKSQILGETSQQKIVRYLLKNRLYKILYYLELFKHKS